MSGSDKVFALQQLYAEPLSALCVPYLIWPWRSTAAHLPLPGGAHTLTFLWPPYICCSPDPNELSVWLTPLVKVRTKNWNEVFLLNDDHFFCYFSMKTVVIGIIQKVLSYLGAVNERNLKVVLLLFIFCIIFCSTPRPSYDSRVSGYGRRRVKGQNTYYHDYCWFFNIMSDRIPIWVY